MRLSITCTVLAALLGLSCAGEIGEPALELGFARRALDGPCPEEPQPAPAPPALEQLEITLLRNNGEVVANKKVSINGRDAVTLGGLPPGEDLELELVGWQNGSPAWLGGALQISIAEGKNSRAQVFMTATGGASCALRTMDTARALMASATLPDGRVLLAGGVENPGFTPCTGDCPFLQATDRVEAFDPRNGLVYPLERLNRPRALASATVLQNGWVLVVGGASRLRRGQNSGLPFDIQPEDLVLSFEVYIPERGVWIERPLPEGLVYHSATLLNDGRVLLAGGGTALSREKASSRAYLYTPAAGWPGEISEVSSRMASERLGQAAVLTPAGNVLLLGGALVPNLGFVEQFTPSESGGVFFVRETSGTAVNLFFPAAGLIPLRPDEILLAGGATSDGRSLIAPSREHIWILSRISTGSVYFTTQTPMSEPRLWSSIMPAWGDRLLLVGGYSSLDLEGSQAVEIFDPLGTLSPAGSLSSPRSAGALAPLAGGRVLAAGGCNGASCLRSAEIITPPLAP
jgi:hypothetical protein